MTFLNIVIVVAACVFLILAIFFLWHCYQNISQHAKEHVEISPPDYSGVPRKRDWTLGRIFLTIIVLFLTYVVTFLTLVGLKNAEIDWRVIVSLVVPAFFWWASYRLIWK
jgi:hypothetical protein